MVKYNSAPETSAFSAIWDTPWYFRDLHGTGS